MRKLLLRPAELLMLAGAIVGGMLGFGLAASPLPGVAKLLVLLAGGLLVPVGQTLSQRFVFVVVSIFGGSLLLWLVPLPLGISQGAGMAVVIGGLAGACVSHEIRAAAGLRNLLPKVAWIDALPFGTLVLSTILLGPVVFPASELEALQVFASSWDFSIQYAVVTGLRQGCSLLTLGQAGPQCSLAFLADHPPGIQVVQAQFMDLLLGPGPQAAAPTMALVVAFIQACGLAVVLLTAAGVAAFTSLGAVRRKPLLGSLAAGLLAGALTVGPGLFPLVRGHAHYFVACVLVLVVMSIAMERDGWGARRVWLLLASVMGAAWAWAPTGGLAVLALMMFLLPAFKGSRKTAGARWGRLVPLVLGVGGLAALLLLLLTGSSVTSLLRQALTAKGGITAPSLTLSVALAGACAAVTWFSFDAAKLKSVGSDVQRLAWLGLVPLVGFLLFGAAALAQYRLIGRLDYYPLKFSIGVAIAAQFYLALAIVILGGQKSLTSRLGGLGARLLAGAVLFAVPILLVSLLSARTTAGLTRDDGSDLNPLSPFASLADQSELLAAIQVAGQVPRDTPVLYLNSGRRLSLRELIQVQDLCTIQATGFGHEGRLVRELQEATSPVRFVKALMAKDPALVVISVAKLERQIRQMIPDGDQSRILVP